MKLCEDETSPCFRVLYEWELNESQVSLVLNGVGVSGVFRHSARIFERFCIAPFGDVYKFRGKFHRDSQQ